MRILNSKIFFQLGGWPIAGSWDENEFDLNRTLHNFLPYGIFPFISVDVSTDSKHSSSHVITVSLLVGFRFCIF